MPQTPLVLLLLLFYLLPLCRCACCRDVFSAGASHFGVADMELLAKDTHKFESRYLDGLVGPYPEVRLPEGVGVGIGGAAAAAGMVDGG